MIRVKNLQVFEQANINSKFVTSMKQGTIYHIKAISGMYKLMCLFLLTIHIACRSGYTGSYNAAYIQIDTLKEIHPPTDSLLSPYRIALEKEMNTILIYADAPFTKGQPQGSLGNLVADIVKESAGVFSPVHFCVLNNGGLRAALPQGAITKGKIFELMPFENEIVVLALTYEQTKSLLHYIIQTGGQPVSGLAIHVNKSLAKEEQITTTPFALHTDSVYYVATSDYLANGGDNMKFFHQPISLTQTGVKIRDAIIEHLEIWGAGGKTIAPQNEKRIFFHE